MVAGCGDGAAHPHPRWSLAVPIRGSARAPPPQMPMLAPPQKGWAQRGGLGLVGPRPEQRRRAAAGAPGVSSAAEIYKSVRNFTNNPLNLDRNY